nr:copia protein [Tanacetum cinerariifolium]
MAKPSNPIGRSCLHTDSHLTQGKDEISLIPLVGKHNISSTKYYKDESCWNADVKSKTTKDFISNRSFIEVLVLNHYVLVKNGCIIPQDVEEDILDIEVAHTGNDPLFSMPIPKVASEQSSSTVSPYTIMHPDYQIPQHNRKWTKDHPLNNIIGLQISQSPRGIFINQSKYALESLKKYGFESRDLVDSPMVEKSKLDKDKEGKAVDPSHYRGERLISWSSKRQKSAAISNMEAEYIALSGCCAQILWMRSQLTDYGHGFNNITMYCDNKSAIALCCNNVQHSSTEYQLANLFTKALGRDRIEFLINKLGMRSFTPETLKQLTDEVDENKVKWHYVRDGQMFTTIKLVSRHQNTKHFGVMLPIELTNEDIRNSEAYKEYYAAVSGAAPPKTKASVRKTKNTNKEGKEFIHPKLSIHDEEETKEEESFDPIAKTPENSDDEGNDDEYLGLNVGSEEGQDAENDEDKL